MRLEHHLVGGYVRNISPHIIIIIIIIISRSPYTQLFETTWPHMLVFPPLLLLFLSVWFINIYIICVMFLCQNTDQR